MFIIIRFFLGDSGIICDKPYKISSSPVQSSRRNMTSLIFRRILQYACCQKNFSTISVGVVGAPFSKGQHKPGVEKGPEALRNAGLVKELIELGMDVKDYGNLEFEEVKRDPDIGRVKRPLSVASACKQLSGAVSEVLKDNRICLTLGGDHSIGMGTVHGHAQAFNDLCVLWVDAHADINTEVTTPSGNMHGMPCSFLIHEVQKYKQPSTAFDWLRPCVHKKNFAYIGLRDIDPLEKLILKKEEILHFSMQDIDKLGVLEVTNRALEAINPMGKCSLHVSFDVDSIDQSIAPSTSVPVPGGLTLREALCIAEEISKVDTLHAVDLVEVNPTIGSAEQIRNTVAVSILVMKTMLGFSRAGNLPQHIATMPPEYAYDF